jgi:hypothetical protein
MPICAGVLHKNLFGVHFGGGRGEDEGMCEISKAEEGKVLAVCSVGSFCEIHGIIHLQGIRRVCGKLRILARWDEKGRLLPQLVRSERIHVMKLLLAVLLIGASAGVPAIAASRIICDGTVGRGSGGTYIISKGGRQCWFGADFSDAVDAVCKLDEHCKVKGWSTTCVKNPDPRLCQDITKVDSISH